MRSAFIGDDLYSFGNQQIQVTNINAPGEEIQTFELESTPAIEAPRPFFNATRSPIGLQSLFETPDENLPESISDQVASLADGVLSVDATNFVDPRIEGIFDASNNQIVIEIYSHHAVDSALADDPFVSLTFDANQVTEVDVQLGDSDNVVNLSQLNVPTQITGGAGDDVLIGGSQRDMIDGGAGNDALFGAAGKDVLRGGDDLLKGQGSSDVLDG